MQRKKKIKFSIFFKLILLITIFIILVNLSLGFFIRFSLEGPPPGPFNKQSPPPHIHEYIIKEVGFPPDTNKAKTISKELNIGIRYETPEMVWSTNDYIPVIDELKRNGDFKNDESVSSINEHGRMYFVHKLPHGYVTLSPPLPRDFINFEKAILAVIIIVTILGSLLYFSLRWIFGPIKKLSAGVQQIGEGNFDNEIEINSTDELGNLADSINQMKSNIAGMIKAKESLLIDVSHELRSPLTRMKLANEFVEDPKIHMMIKNDISEMEEMVSGLLETYRMEKGEQKLNTEKTDLIALTERVISKFNGVKINFNSGFKIREINIDKAKVEVALRNILDNAIKYSDGKHVDVKIFENDLNKNQICLSIKDHGNGIPENELKKIFEPFYRIDKSRDKKISGYGLGLSLVKKILDLHDAVISIKSEPSKGTEFLITFQSL